MFLQIIYFQFKTSFKLYSWFKSYCMLKLELGKLVNFAKGLYLPQGVSVTNRDSRLLYLCVTIYPSMAVKI